MAGGERAETNRLVQVGVAQRVGQGWGANPDQALQGLVSCVKRASIGF